MRNVREENSREIMSLIKEGQNVAPNEFGPEKYGILSYYARIDMPFFLFNCVIALYGTKDIKG